MRTVEIEVEGVTPLLFHRMTETEILSLPPFGSKTRKNKAPKEELTPRQLAECRLYKEGNNYVIPTSFFVGAFRGASSDYRQSNSSKKSMKGIAGSIFRPTHRFVNVLDLTNKPNDKWEVDIAVARNHLKGAVVSCRPRFDNWKAIFSIELDTDLISEDTAQAILNDAGRKIGIGSWRVACSGSYGQFRVIRWEAQKT